MKVSVDVSLYPLYEDYKKEIIAFIESIKENENIHVVVNGMSTQLFGEYDEVMGTLQKQMKLVLSDEVRSVLILKISQGELTRDKIPDHLK